MATNLNLFVSKGLGGIDSTKFQKRFWVLRNILVESHPVCNDIAKMADLFGLIVLNNVEPSQDDIVKVNEYLHLIR